MGAANPPISICTPPMVLATLPAESSVNPAAVAGPMACCESLAKRVMISPGEIGPVAKLAALVNLDTVGSGAVTVRLTAIVVVPGAPPEPATVTVPVYGVG